MSANQTGSSFPCTPLRGGSGGGGGGGGGGVGGGGSAGGLCGGGGVLQESPLQWAIRKRYYAMAELLVTKARADLAHKSAQGSDALHLACKLGAEYIHTYMLHYCTNILTIYITYIHTVHTCNMYLFPCECMNLNT